ncbi:MAG: hypothetical protein JJT85_12625 [Chromatiales bacterium]|nr:hypothetical protein [Chromatiales bacterium]
MIRPPLPALFLLLLATPLRADQVIEVIVFSWTNPPASIEHVLEPLTPAPADRWRAALPLVPASEAGEAGEDDVPEAARGLLEELLPVTRYPLLGPDSLALRNEWRQLERNLDIEPLLHVAWRQPVAGPRGSRAQNLPMLPGARGLHGELRLYRRQSLHLEVDLRLPAGENIDGLPPGEYRLRETRILRSGVLHYLDHPRFGILALVRPAVDGDED